jgi:hypothetical protein
MILVSERANIHQEPSLVTSFSLLNDLQSIECDPRPLKPNSKHHDTGHQVLSSDGVEWQLDTLII